LEVQYNKNNENIGKIIDGYSQSYNNPIHKHNHADVSDMDLRQ